MAKALFLSVAFAALMGAPSVSVAAQQGAAAPAAPVTNVGVSEEDLDKVICRRDIVTGSRAKTRRTCKTRREWSAESLQTAEGLKEFIHKSTGAGRVN